MTLNRLQIDELIKMEQLTNEKIIGDLIDIYHEQVDAFVREAEYLLKISDYSTFSRLAHTLKSSAGNLGLTQPYQICLELEMKSKERAHIDYLQKIEALKAASTSGILELKTYTNL